MEPELAGRIRTRVRTTDGWPLAQAALTVVDAIGGQAGRTISGGDGNAVVADLVPGVYTLVVAAPGCAPVARTITINGGSLDLGDTALTTADGLALPDPGEWRIDPAHSAVRITARHLGLSSVHGRFTDFGGRLVVADPPEGTAVEATIVASSIDTSNADRDTHLRTDDFLAVEKYPAITFASTSIAREGGSRWVLGGDLTLRGITRPVRLDTTFLGTGPDPWGGVRCAFTATTELRRDDYAIDWNQAVRIGIAVVDATLRVELDIQAVYV